MMKRSSGILLPVFSLPSKYGIGDFGREAYNFIDFLEKAGQSYWQILPLGPTGFGDSPYQSFSTFAGNPYFIDLDGLVAEGLLLSSELEAVNWGTDPEKVDYGVLYQEREKVLKKAFQRFEAAGMAKDDFLEFCQANKDWLEDYGNFMGEKQYHRFVQFVFFDQWEKLRNYAHIKGIKIIGDLPIYISMDSSDAKAAAKWLKLDDKNQPAWVAGVPPDYFAEKGQLWGNPIYDWSRMKRDGYSWWMKRLEAAASMFDALRLDHFRGFESYWQVPYGRTDAIGGEWVKGPGWHFLKRVKKNFPGLEIIAEDLGILSPEVHKLLEKTGYPGMKVLQFAFASGANNEHLPHNHVKNSVVYTGTHDNNTIKGWLDEDASLEEKEFLAKYFGMGALNGNEKWSRSLIKGAMASVANLCVIPIQDYLDLASDARINTPSTVGGNWQWRLNKSQLTDQLAEEIREITLVYGRHM